MSVPNRSARVVTWPLRRALDPRFADVTRRVSELSEAVHAEGAQTRQVFAAVMSTLDGHAEGLLEVAGHIGARLDGADARLAALDDRLHGIEEELGPLLYASRLLGSVAVPPEELDAVTAEALDRSDGPDGPAARSGLRPPPVIDLRYSAGAVEIAGVTRAVVEEPFALRALTDIAPTAGVLVVASTFTTLPLALAALGYSVTAVLPTPPPLEVPRLMWQAGAVADAPAGPFDAVVALGALDSVDLATGRELLEELRRRMATGATAVLSARVGVRAGEAAEDALPEHVDQLLDGWTLDERIVVAHTAPTVWQRAEVVLADGLILVRAR